ncbi:MAG: ribonuclease HI family protein [Cyanobacteria bacterium J06636_16]
MPKVLTLWGDTVLRDHARHLYKQVGEQEFLFLPRENGACYVIHQEQVIDFIHAHLTEQRRSRRDISTPLTSQIVPHQAATQKEPPSQTTTLYFDGGDRIELGIGSGGYAIVQGTQESILGGVFLQESSVMVAEYTGLIAGLRKCLEIRIIPTVIKGDNRTVIRQMSGIAKVRNSDLRRLHKEAVSLLDKFNPRPKLSWIPREANSLADQACNHIMDQHIGSLWLDVAPNRAKRRWLGGRRN